MSSLSFNPESSTPITPFTPVAASSSNEAAQEDSIQKSNLPEASSSSPIDLFAEQGESMAEQLRFEEQVTRELGTLLEGDHNERTEYSSILRKRARKLPSSPSSLPKLAVLLEKAHLLQEYFPSKASDSAVIHPGKQLAYCEIAKKYADCGNIADAMVIADQMDAEIFQWKFDALECIAERLADKGDLEGALKCAQSIHDDHYSDKALAYIALKWIALGNLPQASAISKTIHSTRCALPVTESIAKALIDCGNIDAALKIALRFQKLEHYPNIFFPLMEHIVQSLCLKNQIDKAIAVAHQITANDVPVNLSETTSNLQFIKIYLKRNMPIAQHFLELKEKLNQIIQDATVIPNCIWLKDLTRNPSRPVQARAFETIAHTLRANGNEQEAQKHFAYAEEINAFEEKLRQLDAVAFEIDYESSRWRPNELSQEETLIFLGITEEEAQAVIESIVAMDK